MPLFTAPKIAVDTRFSIGHPSSFGVLLGTRFK